ncbi:hypothetical protein J4E85_011126 [Alternaria conjuncta]|uniref:uncharacterized protein n=1 Tax=Alternaria conjuncta TaxID=181017 RepID=UPI002220E357|nr:uncharacterized protein J4E85_011126 [Alternaria conjuncta]KAI4912192.1 hypothetical protein J4E85_011126 [Alternaria conjuncta]
MSSISTDHDASSRDSISSAEDRDASSRDSASSAEDSEDWVDIPAKPHKPSRLSLSLRNNPFVNRIFRLADKTRWKILKPLSLLEFQEDFSPCEARQVYTCVCLDEPWKDVGECIVKIKFQISANQMAIQEYEALVDDDLEYLQSHPNADRKMLKIHEHHLEVSTKPITTHCNGATANEMEALITLGANGCRHAPCLIGVAVDPLRRGLHRKAIVGGYCVFLLMTRLPGKPLGLDSFCKAPRDERDLIREAFRAAWLAVVKIGVVPMDCALRNIMWDKDESRCYIIDFEDIDKVHTSEYDSLSLSDRELALWIPSEEKVAEYLAV